MLQFRLPKIYPITDQGKSGLSHAEQVTRLARGGARLIQIREKQLASKQFFDEASRAVEAARSLNVKIIVNDRVDIALLTQADGVHLGQDDLPPAEARRILGERAIIGYSTHSVEQAVAAISEPVDYIAAGPVFITSTKEKPDPVIGLSGLRAIREAIGDFPLVAIGGLSKENLLSVHSSGADSAAIISDLVSDPELITERMRAFNDLINTNR